MRFAVIGVLILCSSTLAQSKGAGKGNKSAASDAKVRKNLESFGAQFVIDDPKGVHLQFAGNGSDAALEEAAKLSILIGVDVFNSSKVTDKGVAALSKNKSIFRLALTNTSITSKGIEAIAKMTNLNSVRLTTRKLDAASLKSLASMSKLRVLNLDGCSVSDADLVSLKENRTIQILTLRGTDVSGDGLTNLYGMSQLKEIDLVRTTTSKSQIKDLKANIPGIAVRGEGTFFGKKKIPATSGS